MLPLPKLSNELAIHDNALKIGDTAWILAFQDTKIILEERLIVGENSDTFYLEGRGEKLKEFCFKDYYDLLENIEIKFKSNKKSNIAKEFKKALFVKVEIMTRFFKECFIDKKQKKEILQFIKQLWK